MIEGLKIQMTTDDLKKRLAARILCHQQIAEDLEEQNRRLVPGREGPVPLRVLEHEAREHREQVDMLTMLRDHLVPDEVYRLGELDLRFADLIVDIYFDPGLGSEEDGEVVTAT